MCPLGSLALQSMLPTLILFALHSGCATASIRLGMAFFSEKKYASAPHLSLEQNILRVTQTSVFGPAVEQPRLAIEYNTSKLGLVGRVNVMDRRPQEVQREQCRNSTSDKRGYDHLQHQAQLLLV